MAILPLCLVTVGDSLFIAAITAGLAAKDGVEVTQVVVADRLLKRPFAQRVVAVVVEPNTLSTTQYGAILRQGKNILQIDPLHNKVTLFSCVQKPLPLLSQLVAELCQRLEAELVTVAA